MSKNKLLFVCSILLCLGSFAQQNNFIVDDTLRYFEYKQLYFLPPTTAAHPSFKSVAPVSGADPVTHVGSVFKNKDAVLQVYGLEARVLSPNIVVSGPSVGGVKLRLYLCNVSNGFPVFPPLDSITTAVSATQPVQTGTIVGGSFANPVTVSGDFAVLGRCISQLNGDTVKFFRTAGHTATSTTAPSPAYKFGESFGVVRNAGIFYKTTNFNHAAFGVGTDYEFCVAPRVTFSLQASQIVSTTMEGACYSEVFTNTNTSSPELVNRQFNFNEFYRELKPFHPQSAISFSFVPDSVLTWNMGNGAPLIYIKPGLDTVQLSYYGGTCNILVTGSEIAKYKKSIGNINAATIIAINAYTSSCVYCSDSDTVGVKKQGIQSKIKVYPNPATDKITVAGLKGANFIDVYNIMGVLVSRIQLSDDTIVLDVGKFPVGPYLLRISDTKGHNSLVKILRQ